MTEKTGELERRRYLRVAADEGLECDISGMGVVHIVGVSSEGRGMRVITNKEDGIGFDDQEPQSVVDMQFSMPYQLSASLFAGDPGPNWYLDKIARSPQVTNMMKRVRLSFDEECERIWREQSIRVSKVHVVTNDGKRYETRTDGTKAHRSGGKAESGEEIRKKFITTTSQVIDGGLAHDIATTIENLEEVGNVSELIHLLHVPA